MCQGIELGSLEHFNLQKTLGFMSGLEYPLSNLFF